MKERLREGGGEDEKRKPRKESESDEKYREKRNTQDVKREHERVTLREFRVRRGDEHKKKE